MGRFGVVSIGRWTTRQAKADDRCPFTIEQTRGKKTSAVNRQGSNFLTFVVRGEGAVVPDTNLFDLTEAVDLSCSPA